VDVQTQGVKIKRRRSRAEVERLVGEYEASGLGRTAFCQQRGLSLSTLPNFIPRPFHNARGRSFDERRFIPEETPALDYSESRSAAGPVNG
jgi:hypothetical protein